VLNRCAVGNAAIDLDDERENRVSAGCEGRVAARNGAGAADGWRGAGPAARRAQRLEGGARRERVEEGGDGRIDGPGVVGGERVGEVCARVHGVRGSGFCEAQVCATRCLVEEDAYRRRLTLITCRNVWCAITIEVGNC